MYHHVNIETSMATIETLNPTPSAIRSDWLRLVVEVNRVGAEEGWRLCDVDMEFDIDNGPLLSVYVHQII